MSAERFGDMTPAERRAKAAAIITRSGGVGAYARDSVWPEHHIEKHLTLNQRIILRLLVQPISVAQAAVVLAPRLLTTKRGKGKSRRIIEYHYHGIVKALHLDVEDAVNFHQRRVALVRLYYGIDRCWCEDA